MAPAATRLLEEATAVAGVVPYDVTAAALGAAVRASVVLAAASGGSAGDGDGDGDGIASGPAWVVARVATAGAELPMKADAWAGVEGQAHAVAAAGHEEEAQAVFQVAARLLRDQVR